MTDRERALQVLSMTWIVADEVSINALAQHFATVRQDERRRLVANFRCVKVLAPQGAVE